MAGFRKDKKWGDVDDDADDAAAAVEQLAVSVPKWVSKLPPMVGFTMESIMDSDLVSKREVFSVSRQASANDRGDPVPCVAEDFVEEWAQSGLKDEIVHCVTTHMAEHVRPTKTQGLAIPLMLASPKAAFVINAPTGHGKTAAFTLPILQLFDPTQPAGQGPYALVVTEKKSLARMHRGKILEYARGVLDTAAGKPVSEEWQVGVLVGQEGKAQGKGGKGGKGSGGGGQHEDMSQAAKASVVCGTVEKLLKSLEAFAEKGKGKVGHANTALDGRRIKVIVFDEVDALLDGQNPKFVTGILELCPGARPVYVSATVGQRAMAKIREITFGADGGRGGGGRAAGEARELVTITTDQKSRPCFQCNFILRPYESKIETMRRLTQAVPRTGKKLLFSNKRTDVEAICRKYQRPEANGGLALPGTIYLHAGSHVQSTAGVPTQPAPIWTLGRGGGHIELCGAAYVGKLPHEVREPERDRFKTTPVGEGCDNCTCTDDLARGIDIDTVHTVVNLDLPVGGGGGGGGGGGRDKKGGKGGKGGKGAASGGEYVNPVTYLHRLGRGTRSETAFGLCVNVVGGLEEESDTKKGLKNGYKLLEELKAAAATDPALRAFGPMYEVQRDYYREATPDEPLEFEVNVHTKQPDKEPNWVFKPVTVHKHGSPDPNAWEVSFDFNGAEARVSLLHEDVHAPFDYGALETEMALFERKANLETSLIKMIQSKDREAFGPLEDQLAETEQLLADLQAHPEGCTAESFAAAYTWRLHAVTFMKRLVQEALAHAHKRAAELTAELTGGSDGAP